MAAVTYLVSFGTRRLVRTPSISTSATPDSNVRDFAKVSEPRN